MLWDAKKDMVIEEKGLEKDSKKSREEETNPMNTVPDIDGEELERKAEDKWLEVLVNLWRGWKRPRGGLEKA